MARSPGADPLRPIPRSRPLVVMVTGVTSGVGKSTLSRNLAGALRTDGRSVDLFVEEDIRRHEAFSDVMASFAATGQASLAQLLDAAGTYLSGVVRSGVDVVVQDMLLPYLPSLLAWGHDDSAISDFFAELERASGGVDLLQLHLAGDARTSLPRAVEREGEGWLEALTRKVDAFPATTGAVVDGWEGLVSYFEDAEARAVTLAARAPWPVEVIDATASPSDVLDAATRAVRRAG